jgi:hypothetical protein
VGEVHVVRQERLAGGGVGSRDDPVAGAGEAAIADGIAEGLLEGEEVLGGGGVWVFARVWLLEVRKCGRAGARCPYLRIEIWGTRI